VPERRARGRAPELARLTADDPVDETAWVLCVGALNRAGRHADALAAVARARRALAEIGLDPGPELAAAQADVLAGPATARRTSPPVSPAETRDPVRYTPDGATAYAEQSGAQRVVTPRRCSPSIPVVPAVPAGPGDVVVGVAGCEDLAAGLAAQSAVGCLRSGCGARPLPDG
jgi:hypothetical protein